MAKRRCLKRRPGKTACLKWARPAGSKPKARKRSTSRGRVKRSGGGRGVVGKATCVGAPFRMKTKTGYKCACVAKTRKGTLIPKFQKHDRCGAPGTKASTFASERRQYIPMVRI